MFAQSDFSKRRDPLWVVHALGQRWLGPERPNWLVPEGECPVLHRAIRQYGVHEFTEALGQRMTAHAERLLTEDGEPAELAAAHIFKLPYSGAVPLMQVVGIESVYVSATFVYYVTRRFGTEGKWVVIPNLHVLRYESGGAPLAVVATVEQRASWELN